MYKFNFHAVAPFASHALSLLVFAFLIAKNPRSKLHITLGLFCLGASLWQLSTAMMFIAQTDELALFWDRVVYVGVNFQWIMHFHFTVLLLNARDQKRWLIAGYALAITFAIFTPTDYLVHDLYRYAWGCHSIAGPLHHAFVLVSTGFYIKCLLMIHRRFRQTKSPVERNQYKYYMVGFVIFVSASLAYLPAYEVAIYPFAYWFESIYCLMLVYIIVKHRMLAIETVIHKTLLWLSVSVATFVPVAVGIYLAHPVLSRLSRLPQVMMMGVVIAISIAIYSTVQPRIDHLFRRRARNYRAVLDRFLRGAVTLNDKKKLAQATIEAIGGTLYSARVRCFWGDDTLMLEEQPLSGEPLELRLDGGITLHMTRRFDLVERDLLSRDPVYQPVHAQLEALFEQTQTVILLPIVHEGALHGMVLLDRKASLEPYTDVDKEFLREVSVGMSFAVINSLMFDAQRELFQRETEARKAQEELLRVTDEMNRQLEQKVEQRTRELSRAMSDLITTRDALWGEMQLAKRIQTCLLPEAPAIVGYELVTHMSPADEVGGDYYDIINTGRGDWLVVGDVAGHGVGAGLVMMMVHTAIHTALERNPDTSPRELLSHVNEVITRSMRRMNEAKHITITALRRDADGSFCFSGLHQDILVYRSGPRKVEAIATEGVWLGLISPIDELLVESSFALEVGDVMLLFTDGITEAARRGPNEDSPGVAEMFGQARLGDALAGAAEVPLAMVKERILAALDEFRCMDDVTFILARRTS